MKPAGITDSIRFVTFIMVAAVLSFSAGCQSGQKKKRAATVPQNLVLRVTHHLGGTHYRTIIYGEHWYQTFGNQLLVIDPRTARPMHTLDLCEFGACGAAVDMAITDAGDMYIVLERDEALTLSLDDPARPVIVARRSAEDLRFAPLSLSVVEDGGAEHVYICGDGGAAEINGTSVVIPGEGIVQSVAMGGKGLVATVDRRVYEVKTGAYIGSASELQPMPDSAAGEMIFIRRTGQATQIGVMEPDIRERQARTATTAVMGDVHRVRTFDGSMWIVAPDRILAYTLIGDNLELRDSIKVRGARDVDMISANYLAVAGSFGRAIYRLEADEKGPGDTFLMAQREPSRLTHAISDRLQVLAGTPEEGTWLYQIGSDATLMDKALTQRPPAPRAAEITDGGATIAEDSTAVLMTIGGTNIRWTHGRQWKLYTIVAVEGRLWVGHEHGLVVLEVKRPTPEEIRAAQKAERPEPQPTLAENGEIRLDGPVLYMFPLLTGRGATYVAEYGGFGMAELIPEAAAEVEE